VKPAQVPQELRKLTRLQLQEALLKLRQDNRELRGELGEAVRIMQTAKETIQRMNTALEAIALIADARMLHATDEWSLIADVARTALRKARL
jgi:hypothetical protein